MKTQLTTRCLLRVILCILALGSYAWADGGFLDDFSDGDTQDGSPVTWRWDASMGECVVTPEGLQVTPTWPGPNPGAELYVFAQDAYGRDVHYTGNVTVRALVKVPESTEGFGSNAFVCLRTGDAAGGGYLLGINRLYFHIQRLDGYSPPDWYSPWQWDSKMNGRFDPAQDVMIQFDVIDLTDAAGNRTTSRLEGRWWLPGQEMPAQPQVVATDAKFDAGGIAIGNVYLDGLNSGVSFRWVEVISTDPNTNPDINGDGGFVDDFSDGSIQDGSPVTWQWDPQRGQCAVSPQGLQLSPAQVYWSALVLLATDKHGARVQYSSNMTVKAQFNLGIEPTTSACIALVTADHQPGSATGSYLLAFNRNWFFLARDDIYREDWHWSTQGRFDPADDIIIQLDLIDITDDGGHRTASRLECRWCVAGQAMPVQAQIVGVDSMYDVSSVMLGAFTDSVEGSRTSPVVFRWIEVIGSEIEPNVDINGDSVVDFKDYCILADSWHSNEEPADIAPSIRDGVVDLLDLARFAGYWLKQVPPANLIACWKLDETDGSVAFDSIGDNDGELHGDPNWQPGGGYAGGALQFDGVGDYISTESALNPADGSFSVFAWTKGGSPGQSIISQVDVKVGRTTLVGSTWLGTDPSEGKFITTLMEYPFGPLESEIAITDGQWHHVGLVYDLDDLCRCLYVDGIEVARDVGPVGGAPSGGSLYIGAGKNLDAGSFFSGLIDEIRIYNVALSAAEIEELAR